MPAVIPLILVRLYGMDLPFWDEWAPDLGGLYIKFCHHQLTLGNFWAQHNEHRMLIPRLILLPIQVATHFNTVAEMIAEWVIICLTSIGVLRLIRQTHDEPKSLRVVGLWFLCNLLIFTPGQWENLIWGCGVINVLPMALIVWMMVSLLSQFRPMAKTIISIVLAIAATYSSGNGMLAWPIALALVVLSGESKWKSSAAIWLVAAIIFCGLYFVGYQKPDHGQAQPYATSVVSMWDYFITFLGTPFAFSSPYPSDRMAPIVGLVMLILAIGLGVFAWRMRVRRAVCWLCVAFFAVASAALAGITRAGFGPAQAIESTRYVSFSLYLPVALLVLTLMICGEWARRANDSPRREVIARIPVVLASVIVVLQVFSYSSALASCEFDLRARRATKASILLINFLPDSPEMAAHVYPEPDVARREANALSELHALRPPVITSSNAATIQETDLQRIAQIKGAAEQGGKRSDGQFGVSGWAVRTDQVRPVDAVFLTYDNPSGEPIIFGIAQMGMQRDDIAEQLGDDNYDLSGWVGIFPVTRFPSEMHQVNVRAWTLDTDTGKATLLPGTVRLQLR
jgi:hypothetical protein